MLVQHSIPGNLAVYILSAHMSAGHSEKHRPDAARRKYATVDNNFRLNMDGDYVPNEHPNLLALQCRNVAHLLSLRELLYSAQRYLLSSSSSGHPPPQVKSSGHSRHLLAAYSLFRRLLANGWFQISFQLSFRIFPRVSK